MTNKTNKPDLGAIDALIAAGGKANDGVWYTTREVVDIDYYDAVRVKGEPEDLPLFCHPENCPSFPIPNYSDYDARFVTHAANTRSEIKKLRDAYEKQTHLIEGYEKWDKDVKHLTKKIDVIINGQNAAQQASLCDVVGCVQRQAEAIKVLREALDEMKKTYPYNPPCHNWERQVAAHKKAKQALERTKEFDDE